MITPRAYQGDALQAIRSAHARGLSRQLLVLPTGSGKTIIMVHLIGAMAPQGRILILVHRDELVHQTREKLQAVAPDLSFGIVKAGQNDIAAPLVLASAQTLSRPRRLQQLGTDWALVVADEAHHYHEASTWTTILHHACGPRTLLLGCTATPYRPNGQPLLGDTWHAVVYHQHLARLVADGYLTDLRCKRVHLEGFRLSDVKQSHGDYQAGDLEDHMLDAKSPQQIVEAIHAHARDRRIAVFSPGIEHAEQVTKHCEAAGIVARTIVGATPWEARQAAYAAVSAGKVQVLSSVMVLTEGFDLPCIDCVVLARATRSKVLFTQVVGRGLRPSPETGKVDCLLLDATGAGGRHALMSVAELYGLARLHEGQSVVEALDAGQAESEEEEGGQAHLGGKVHSRDRDLLRRNLLAWVKTPKGAYALSLGDSGMMRICPVEADRWRVEYRKRDAKLYQVLEPGVPLPYAFGIGEDTIRSMRVVRLANPDEQWRNAPATPGQIEACRKLRIALPPECTKGQASTLITAKVADFD